MSIDIGHDTYLSTFGKFLENELDECNNLCSCQCRTLDRTQFPSKVLVLQIIQDPRA